ncbi:MAG: hypothetical protein ABI277_00105 [Burkholderiaceae bacterium]
MRSYSLIAAVAATAGLAGCVSYPVYQPVPVARLTPAQSAALASRPITQADRDNAAAANAQAQREDQADQYAQRQAAVVPYIYAYPATPYYDYGYGGGYYGYPGAYYGGFSPWYPGLSLSFGYRGGFGGYRGGYRGGYHGGHGGGGHGHR